MTTKVFPILSQYMSKTDTVVVGVSGGPDSVALLSLLVNFYASFYPSTLLPSNPNIIIAHVNHGIRGREADRDEKFVQNLARKYSLKCFIKRVKLAGKSNIEERGRHARRAFFEQLQKRFNAKWIITAHTQDDNVETIISNFLRGSGLAGLTGMSEVNGFYLKPLLNISKKEILAYLKEKNLHFCMDKTNEDTSLRRNFIRKKIIPLFQQLNPSLKKTLLRNAQVFREIDSWLTEEAGNFLKNEKAHLKSKNAIALSKHFLKLPIALQTAVIQIAFAKWSCQPYRLSAVKIEEILRMVAKNVGKKKIQLGNLGKGGCFYLDKGVISLKFD